MLVLCTAGEQQLWIAGCVDIASIVDSAAVLLISVQLLFALCNSTVEDVMSTFM